jgi:uncharacterized membrane protein
VAQTGRKDWVITVLILLGLNSSILMEYFFIYIPLIRQIFGFLALTFLPGFLVLRIFRTHTKTLSEFIFLSIALSISLVMFLGIFANFVYSFVGVEKPITLLPILLSLNILLLVLLFIQQRQTLFDGTLSLMKNFRIANWDLFFILLPILSLLSAYQFSHYGDNRGTLLLYFLIALTPLIFVKVRNFNRTFAIWSVAISLIWSAVFGVSWDYLWGYDINSEYYWAHKVLSQGFWNTSLYGACNTIASTNILAPVISVILGLDLIKIFKIVYPLLFSLVPIILLKAYEHFLEKKIWAELSVLFFMFLFTFFTEMMTLARQMIAEIYLALLVYATVRKSNPLFLVIFLASLAISHYGIAYLTMTPLFVLSACVFAVFMVPKVKERLPSYGSSNFSGVIFWLIIALFFCGVTLLWYQNTGGGYEFHKIRGIASQTQSKSQEILNPMYSQGLAIILKKTTLTREIAKWSNLLAQGLISLGVVVTIYSILSRKTKKLSEFYILSVVFFFYGVSGIVVPLFSNWLGASRLYHIILFFLSPYLIVGSITLSKTFHELFRIVKRKDEFQTSHITKNVGIFLAAFLFIYFLFNSGFLMVVANDQPPMWLNKFDGPYWSHIEVHGAKWVVKHRNDSLPIYADQHRALLFLGLIGQEISKVSLRWNTDGLSNLPERDAYMYFGRLSTGKGEILAVDIRYAGTIKEKYYIPVSDPAIVFLMDNSNKVYSSDEVWIYYIKDTCTRWLEGD